MFEQIKKAGSSVLNRLGISPAPLSRTQRRQNLRAKPKQSTIIRRGTAKNLLYLVEHGLTPTFNGNYSVARNLREKFGGKFQCPNIPTNGV